MMFSHRSWNRELEDLFEFLPPELLRKLKKAMVPGATPVHISEETEDVSLGNDSMKAGFQSSLQKKEKANTPRPRQESLF